MIIRAIQYNLLACMAIALSTSAGATASAALPIDIEIAMESGLPITAPQEWAKRLGKLDLRRVQLRSARPGDQPTLETTESANGLRIKIVAILTRRNELVLPKRRFKANNLSALRSYLEQLATEGTEADAERGRFDLTEKQFSAVHANLSKKVGFSTTTLTTAEILNRFEEKFSLPMNFDSGTRTRLNGKPIGIELSEMAVGTALAIALRQEGMALRPEKPRDGSLQLRVLSFSPILETWPVGWKSSASKTLLAPKMFESLNIEIANYTLSQALEALAPRLGVPLILDRWILEQLQIDPSKIEVKHPRRKTYLKRAVDRVLSQASLVGELRVDELGNVFYWVTQFGNNSLRAE